MRLSEVSHLGGAKSRVNASQNGYGNVQEGVGFYLFDFHGDPAAIRTRDPQIRNLVLI